MDRNLATGWQVFYPYRNIIFLIPEGCNIDRKKKENIKKNTVGMTCWQVFYPYRNIIFLIPEGCNIDRKKKENIKKIP